MSEKKQFKLIGVRPLKGCAPHIRKILKEDTTYFIYNEYEVDPENPELIKRREDVDPIHKTFFSNKEDSPLISISAIVGKNGDGKSTIIELIIRIINNFAYAIGYQSKHEDLRPIDGLNAILYFSIGEYNIFYIKSELKNNNYYISTNFLNRELDINNPEQDIHELLNEHDNKKELEKILFYTQISNYSLYAYNALDLQYENLRGDNYCWINGIFHKNDSYQTPIVLNPWRNNGNIDVNNENYLALQRLLSLYVQDQEIRIMNDKQVAMSIIFKEDESKLISKTYRDYFQSFMRVNVDLLENIYNDLTYYVENKSKELSKLDYVFDNHIYSILNIKSIIEKHTTDFTQALKIVSSLREKLLKEGINYVSDFNKYLDLLTLVFEKHDSNNLEFNLKKKDALNAIEYLQKGIIDGYGYSYLNINIIQRVITVISIRELWEKKLNQKWDIQSFYGDSTKSLAQQYITYKTISIFQKYDPFKKYESISILDKFNSLFIFSSRKSEYINTNEKCFSELIEDIEKRKSHVTLKLRQTLAYLLYNESYNYIKSEDKNQTKIEELNLSNSTFLQNSFLIDLDIYDIRLKETIRNEIENETSKQLNLLTVEQLLIPGFFKTDIVFQDLKNKQEYFLFSELSSGERQLLHNVSSVVYHLKNIDSVSSDTNHIKYKHVNIIFEEIELYFHPEYQRKYINYLLDLISKANLKQIESLNMCFVTHSPFILSDIPKNNVLFLQEGSATRKMQEDTFGGNIHSLLQNGFFLDSVPVGEFAKKKINEMFERLHQGKTYFKEGTSKEFYNQILLVSEPFIQSQLLKMYHELKPKSLSVSRLMKLSNLRIIELEARLKELEEKLNDKNI